MSLETTANGRPAGRSDYLLTQVIRIFQRVLGVDSNEITPDTRFLALGADSLMLLQASQAIHDEIRVRIPFRLLFDELSTPAAVAKYVAERNPRIEEPPQAAAPTPKLQPPVAQPKAVTPHIAAPPRLKRAAAPLDSASASSVEKIIAAQLRLMEQQLQLVAEAPLDADAEPEVQMEAAPPPTVACEPCEPRQSEQSEQPQEPRSISQKIDPEHYVAYHALGTSDAGNLGDSQQQYLQSLIERVSKKTAGSKRMAQDYRGVMADSRSTARFQKTWKELCYPLVVDRAQGCHVWDVDGNRYLDITMGFGALMFGHTPDFLIGALDRQVQSGIQLGWQSKVAGEASKLLCELAGVDRAAFCNSGTEAMMSALRLARAATGRDRIAMFAGAYHGTFDGVLVKGEKASVGMRTAPLAPGIPQHMIENVTVLEYCSHESLRVLEEIGGSLAAIVVEPAQSRRPDLQPKEFLKELRRIADACGAVLIFDEVVTGFRTHPGGAQALFDVKADLVAYGKAVGGGVPVGVVAGKTKYMDAVDGGTWQFGDRSIPEAETTIFMGTYFKHPLIAAAVHATLSQFTARGPALQEELTRKTSALVQRLNVALEEMRTPVRAVSFGSLFRFVAPRSLRFWELFYFCMLERGVYVAETRTCFLSTAHQAADIDFLVDAVVASIRELQAVGFIPETAAIGADVVPLPAAPKSVPLTDAQLGLLALIAVTPEAGRAYNELAGLRMTGRLDRPALRRALRRLTNRHESLRAGFSIEDTCQRILPWGEIPLAETDLTDRPELAASELNALIERETQTSFDLEQPPLARAHLVRTGPDEHVLCLTIHHLVADGWSFGVLMEELGKLYSEECTGTPAGLPEPAQISEFVIRQQQRQKDPAFRDAERYWLERFSGTIQPLDLPGDRPRPAVQQFQASREKIEFPVSLRKRLKAFAAANECTIFTLLLGSVQCYLHRITGQDDVILGTHSAGQPGMDGKHLVGFCLNMLPIRARFETAATFRAHLERLKEDLRDAYRHEAYPISRLVKALRLVRDPGRPALVSFIVNMDRIAASELDREGAVFAGLKVSILDSPVVASRFDMLWSFLETPDSLTLNVTYSSEMFDAVTVREWLREYCDLLEQWMAMPDAAVGTSARSECGHAMERAFEARLLSLGDANHRPVPV